MIARLVPVLVVGCVLAVGCGGNQAKPRAASTTKPREAPVIVGPGRLVDIGGGRSLYLNCVGSGSPTVLLEAGFGGNTNNWSAVQPQLGRTTRTCAYDRAGLGNSLPIPGVHDAGDEIDDLERLLDHAHLAPPYVVVGHSYGGLLARLFAHAHPDQTAGVVLVDSMGRNQDRRLLALWRAAPARVRRMLPKPTGETIEDGVNILAGEALAGKITTLGDTPVAVVTRGQSGAENEGLPPRVRRAFDGIWTRMQDELAALSSDHLHVVATRSDHFVQSFAGGQPPVVIGAVRAVVTAARTHNHLPACGRLFRGSGVRCLS
jgi:pimeloyl-ACP methyl ester carboxylesterase